MSQLSDQDTHLVCGVSFYVNFIGTSIQGVVSLQNMLCLCLRSASSSANDRYGCCSAACGGSSESEVCLSFCSSSNTNVVSGSTMMFAASLFPPMGLSLFYSRNFLDSVLLPSLGVSL